MQLSDTNQAIKKQAKQKSEHASKAKDSKKKCAEFSTIAIMKRGKKRLGMQETNLRKG